MPGTGFETTIPVSQWSKTIRASDRSASSKKVNKLYYTAAESSIKNAAFRHVRSGFSNKMQVPNYEQQMVT